MTCSCSSHHFNKKDLMNVDNNNSPRKFLFEDSYFEKDKQLQNNNFCDMRNIDDENASAVVFPESRKSGMKRLFQLAVVMYGMVFCGMVYGYTSPAFPSLIEESRVISNRSTNKENIEHSNHNVTLMNILWMDDGDDLKITELEASWVSSISSLGFPVGALLSSLFIDIMGKKWTAIFGQAGSYCIGYSLITFAVNVECIYAGRFFCGICQGFCNCLTIVYTFDLCHTAKERALAGTILSLLGNGATLVIYIVGLFVEWRALAAISTAFCFPYLAGITFLLPASETSLDCTSDGIPTKAMNHEKKYDNLLHDIEVSSTKEEYQIKKNPTNFTKSSDIKVYLRCPEIWKGLGLMFFYQFAGYNVVSFYASSILNNPKETEKQLIHPNESTNIFSQLPNDHIIIDNSQDEVISESLIGFELDPALAAAVIVATAGLLGVIIGVLLVRKGLNRKNILLVSGCGTAVAFIVLGIFFHLDFDGSSLLVPTLSLTSHILLFNLGYGCLGYPAMAEMLPSNLKVKGLTFIQICGGIFAFANSKSFGDLDYYYGPSITFAVYGSVNLLGTLYMYTLLPSSIML